ncbi:MAG: hypothetical protein ABEK36_00130 [Candidatus Aenigmatarchaeota archaeon]
MKKTENNCEHTITPFPTQIAPFGQTTVSRYILTKEKQYRIDKIGG